MKTSLIAVIVVLTSCLSMTSCMNQTENSEAWYFVVTAKEAELKGNELTLFVDRDHLFAFTDRPNRKFTTLSFKDWSRSWEEGSSSFKKEPPNAMLIGTSNTENKKKNIVKLELVSQPEKVAGGYRFQVKKKSPLEKNGDIKLMDTVLYVEESTYGWLFFWSKGIWHRE